MCGSGAEDGIVSDIDQGKWTKADKKKLDGGSGAQPGRGGAGAAEQGGSSGVDTSIGGKLVGGVGVCSET